ncbi:MULTISPECIES: TRAP transporter substrate-binding protein [Undibacterium]|uniref:TRAP transporter substrate-binding protein n=1 Tax=Undibacterium umbellatum TaxID=2762300 RepID=A0ABR6ZDT7_9BURK|nr:MULTISPECIES: TRAP transporter substrate-binding protein [Undibacterium]MBC3909907.1 TRAP transporter substrate-binding protein [Undibacterium umbellatum]MDP1976865.1 TRAP transporter substrate-binding protein [Undibacterium sp.]
MERRSFLKKAAASASVGAAVAAPALAADALPTLNWRLTSSFPKSLDTIFGASEVFAARVKELTDGKLNIRVFSAGEIVPGTAVLDAVQNGTVEMGHTASYYYFGKDPTFAFDTAVPFGLTSRQQTAWMLHGNGMKLMREFFAEYNVVNFLGGNTGTQMGGWFRKEIKTPADLNGLKFRVGGFAGRVLSKLGTVPQQIAGGDIYPALEKGTIDAAEWVGPYDDEKLGFNKIAKFYYYPGWWEGGAQLSFYVSKKEWDKLPKQYQAAIEAASHEAHNDMQAKYDARNPAALGRLLAQKINLKPFPQPVMDACFKAAQETFSEEVAKNPKFAKVYTDWINFRNNQGQWFGVAEQSFARFNFGKALK